ncbi:MAG: hypothetical protein HYY16_00835 [Planctomycetes bacterium]|nr:hypothetical protein [Planctomycetota bacterium]
MELVIALAVLALALAGVIGAIMNSMVASSLDRQLNVARDAAMAKIDEARARNYKILKDAASGVGSLYQPQPPPDPPPSPPTGTESFFEVRELGTPAGMPSEWRGGFGRIFLDPVPPSDDIMSIRILILWQSERGVRQFETSTIVTR